MVAEAEIAAPVPQARGWLLAAGAWTERLILPVLALLAGFAAFALFLILLGKNPLEFYALVFKAGFGTAFSWSNTLSRAAPLLLAALCVAIPARLGLVVIGGEGAIVLGGVVTGGLALHLAGWPALLAMPLLAIAAAVIGAIWIGAAGALRQ